MQINKTYCPKTESKYTNIILFEPKILPKQMNNLYSATKNVCEIDAGLAHFKLLLVNIAEVLIYGEWKLLCNLYYE